MTLTDFLLARIAEDEAVALGQGDWRRVEVALAHDWYRARVLAECEAKRRIVEESADWLDRINDRTTIQDRVLGWLALPYSNHSDFREEWRP